MNKSPFWHYNTVFDALEVVQRHAAPELTASPDHLTNYLGVKIAPKFFPSLLDDRAGTVEGPPIPANWHADIAEFAAALRAVELSSNHFTMIELGCGWGCWMNITGVAARRMGKTVSLIGIEGDQGHVAFAKEALETNRFTSAQYTLYHGIAAAKSGTALFPKQQTAGESWGLSPVFHADAAQRAEAVNSGNYDELPIYSLADILKDHSRVDLLHIDIQGGEAELVSEVLGLLQAKVSYVLIGTHSRQIEGQLFQLLLNAGWKLEIERPAIYNMTTEQPIVAVDGVEGWRNADLLPEA